MPSPLYSGAAAYNLGVLIRQDISAGNFMKKSNQMMYSNKRKW